MGTYCREVKIAFYGNDPYDYECKAKKILKMKKALKEVGLKK